MTTFLQAPIHSSRISVGLVSVLPKAGLNGLNGLLIPLFTSSIGLMHQWGVGGGIC
jgi:hypothetical protein